MPPTPHPPPAKKHTKAEVKIQLKEPPQVDVLNPDELYSSGELTEVYRGGEQDLVGGGSRRRKKPIEPGLTPDYPQDPDNPPQTFEIASLGSFIAMPAFDRDEVERSLADSYGG